ncbi:hypothetical protein KEM55_000652 [Ascosphaera atra]|nr:hypothetical protein KEM55_000652 [Ascosphaera atra]
MPIKTLLRQWSTAKEDILMSCMEEYKSAGYGVRPEQGEQTVADEGLFGEKVKDDEAGEGDKAASALQRQSLIPEDSLSGFLVLQHDEGAGEAGNSQDDTVMNEAASAATTQGGPATMTQGSLPPLSGEEGLDDWDQQIYQTLAVQDLVHYIEKSVPELSDTDEKARWHKERATVSLILTSSLSPTVKQTLDNHGLSRQELNPHIIYTLVKKAVPSLSADARGSLIVALGQLNIEDFDGIPAFQSRVQSLKKQLTELGISVNDGFYLWFVANALKTTYPDDYRFIVRDLEKGDMTWEKLMLKLSNNASSERLPFSFVKLTTQDLTPTNVRDHANIYCHKCKKSSPSNYSHCPDCRKCHNPSVCWSKDPSKAPSWWSDRRQQRDTSSTAPMHTQGGLLNPQPTDFSGLTFIGTNSHGQHFLKSPWY